MQSLGETTYARYEPTNPRHTPTNNLIKSTIHKFLPSATPCLPSVGPPFSSHPLALGVASEFKEGMLASILSSVSLHSGYRHPHL